MLAAGRAPPRRCTCRTDPGDAAAEEHAGPPRPLYKRLPRGPHRLGRGAVARNQRVRIHGAMVRALAAEGYDGISVRLLIGLAGVSRRSFYEQFAGKQDCFLATFDEIAKQHLALVRRTCALTQGGGHRRLEAAIGAYAAAIAGDPDAAALVLLHPLPPARRARSAFARPAPRGNSCSAPRSPAALFSPRPPPPKRRSEACRESSARGCANPAPARAGCWRASSVGGRWPRSCRRGRPTPGASRRSCATTRAAPRRRLPGPPTERPRGDRERLLGAALRLAARERVALLSAAQICDEARVPLAAFFELFTDRDDCLRAAIADAGERLIAIAGGADRSGADWPRALHETLVRMLSHLAAHPLHARAVTVLAASAGPRCRSYGVQLEAELAARLGAGHAENRRQAGAAVVGALWHLVRCHLADRRIRRLPSAAGHLTLLALAPAIGPDGAADALRAGH